MSILPKLGRRALTSITATAIIAGGVVAPQALADDIKNADLYWGFSGSSHHKFSANGATLGTLDNDQTKIELIEVDKLPKYQSTFNSGKLLSENNRVQSPKALAFHDGKVENKENDHYIIKWQGTFTLKLGYNNPIEIKDLELQLQGQNSGTLKATVGSEQKITLLDIQSYEIKGSDLIVYPKVSECTGPIWKPWDEKFTKAVETAASSSTASSYLESYGCSVDNIARQPLPLTVVLNAEKPAEQANPASNKDNTSGEHSDQEHSVISDQEPVDSPEVAAGDTTFSKAKEFLGTKIGRILTIGLSVLGGLGALWTLWTKFSHLFIR
ncbi:hypothetical protein [Corynebacterium rouxii]|uniref:Cell-surface hemin receptor n=1 Tax=Corynebacterium rouxii TaxID=2719119 RepID=A0ABU3PK44_9CORY|nr:hypothetical protein [Corynebacterium rouxii]MDT9407663.1 hypothetical protein [Corynebacterium rouxii]MDT9409844.1 hypothetical protein [Corynebacterium rouxii]